MTVFKVGEATITRVEETNVPSYQLRDVFPELTDAELKKHLAWLAPHHYVAETGAMRLAVHSWLLQVGGKKILIDACCGNQKNKPAGRSGTCSTSPFSSASPRPARGPGRSTW